MADLTGFRAYATARGYAAPGIASDTDAGAALVRGQDYIVAEYVTRFAPGYDETAPNVEPAIYEAALAELVTTGAVASLRPSSFWASTYTPSDRKVLVGVDSIKWQVIGSGSDARAMPVSTRIEGLLRIYMVRVAPIGIWAIG